MNKVKHISSIQNPSVKRILALRDKSRERKKTGLFVIEGKRELKLAIEANYQIDSLFICEKLIDTSQIEKLVKNDSFLTKISVSLEVYAKMAYRDSTEGIIAIVNSKEHGLDTLEFKTKNPLILVAEATEKPGNIGALLRTADAANLDAVLIANPKTDLYNPNIIRSSVGCVFSRNIALASSLDIISFLKERQVSIYCAALTASVVYSSVDYRNPTAIIVGTEDKGLSEEWLQASTKNIIIPMEGSIDSMNVSVSAAILIFEAKRQRKIV